MEQFKRQRSVRSGGSIRYPNDSYYEAIEQRIVDYARWKNLTYTQAEERLLELSPLTRRALHEYFQRKRVTKRD